MNILLLIWLAFLSTVVLISVVVLIAIFLLWLLKTKYGTEAFIFGLLFFVFYVIWAYILYG